MQMSSIRNEQVFFLRRVLELSILSRIANFLSSSNITSQI